MQKEEALLRAQERVPAVPEYYRRKFLHVIARSEATWQSVLLAVGQNEKQYFGQIRKSSGFALGITNLQSFSAGTRIATPLKRTGPQ